MDLKKAQTYLGKDEHIHLNLMSGYQPIHHQQLIYQLLMSYTTSTNFIQSPISIPHACWVNSRKAMIIFILQPTYIEICANIRRIYLTI